ncbi:MAG: ATP synthase F1 subunit delta [Thermoguttaceae bacterium]|nr:ATP synthase F1 subunit delta [Thermoguttaceae bacterium]
MSTDVNALDSKYAAEVSPDVTMEKISSVYADALFGVIDNDLQKVKEILGEYAEFIQDVLDVYPEYERILASKLISADEKIALIERNFNGVMNSVLFDFFRVVAKHERLDCIRAIYCEALKKYDKLAMRIPVVITTAAPISQDVIEKITQGLAAKFKGELVVTCKVDPNQIGGLVVRVGDTIYDGSIAAQLENMRRNIVKNYAPKTELN